MFLFYKKRLTNTISRRPQPLFKIVLNSSYPIFSIFCSICPYMEIRSQTPGIWFFLIFLFFKKCLTNAISMSPQPLFKVVFNSSYPIFSIFCPICPYMEIRSQTSGILNFLKFSYFKRRALLIRFQRSLDHSSKMFLTQVILYFLYFAPYTLFL